MSSAGMVVWLRARPGTLSSRAVGAIHRPWLDGDPLEWFLAASAEREELYASIADLVVDVDDLSAAQVTAKLAEGALL